MSDSMLTESSQQESISTLPTATTANTDNSPSDADISGSAKVLKEKSLSMHDQQRTFDKIEREKREGELFDEFQTSCSSPYNCPPPSYGESTAPTMPFHSFALGSSASLGKPPSFSEPDYSFTFTPPPSYYKMPLKNLGFQTKRQLGFYLDPEQASVPNWKYLADEMGFSNLHVSKQHSNTLVAVKIFKKIPYSKAAIDRPFYLLNIFFVNIIRFFRAMCLLMITRVNKSSVKNIALYTYKRLAEQDNKK